MRPAERLGDPASILPQLASDAAPSDILTALRGTGAAIVNRVLPVEQRALLDRQLAPVFTRAFAGEGPFFGRRTRRFSALFERAPATAELALHPAILGAVETLLKGDPRAPVCDAIQLNLTQAIAIDPGEVAQALHRDQSLFPIELGAELMVNVLFALDRFTAANGATRIIPFSHRWPRDRRGSDAEAIAAEAPAGSAILWLGSTWHGGGANLTQASRRGLVFSYSLGWLAPAEKLLLSIPPDTARRLPRQLQRLIGYQVHRPNLGWVEGRDPLEWLERPGSSLAAAADNLPDDVRRRIEETLRARAAPVG